MSTSTPNPPIIHSVRSHPAGVVAAAGALAAVALSGLALATSDGPGVESASPEQKIVRPGTGQVTPATGAPDTTERMRRSAERFHHRR
jgi:hypothetical protein